MSMSTKKLFILCLVFSLLLVTASCGNSTSSDSAAALEFMNIPWNSTPAQVIEAMNFSEADIEQTETPENGLYAITAHDVEIFGTTALTVIFQFDDYTRQGEHYGLDSILIYFPDESETETAKIANELTAMYADAFEGLESYTHFLDSTGGQWVEEYAPASGKAWVAGKTLADTLPENVKDNFKAYVMAREYYPLTESAVADNLSNPIAELTWNTNAHPNMTEFPEGKSNVTLYYNAAEYVSMLQLFAQPYSD